MPLKAAQHFMPDRSESKNGLLPNLTFKNPFYKYRFLRSIVESPLTMHTGNRSDFARYGVQVILKKFSL
jgi:hypothetical protein